MKIKTIILTMFAVLAMANLTACSDTEEVIDDSSKVAGYKFELTFTSVDGTDNDDIIKTSYSYKDNNGVEGTGIYNTFPKEKVESQMFKKLPATLTINVLEELKSDIKLTKSNYNVGLGLKFTIYSCREDGTIISSKGLETSSTTKLTAEDLSNMYPETTTFNYAIDKDGGITKVE